MAKPPVPPVIDAVKLVGRADAACRKALEFVREAAAMPGYCGPATLVEDLDRAVAGLAAVRVQIVDEWLAAECLRAPCGGAGRPVVERPVFLKLGRPARLNR